MIRRKWHIFLCAVFVVFVMNAPNVLGSGTSRMIEEIKKSVITIEIDMRGQGYEGSGTGFIAHMEETEDEYVYYVFSNKHVGGAQTERLMARFENEYENFRLEFVGEADDRDFSVWKFARKKTDGYKLPVISLGDSSKVNNGDEIYALGHPMGYGFVTTHGIVSKNPFFFSAPNVGIEDVYPFIMVDSELNPGNSGGVLVNKYGQWVGINSVILFTDFGPDRPPAKSGLGIAIPSNSCWGMFRDIMEYGEVRRPMIGVVLVNPGVEVMFPFVEVHKTLIAKKINLLSHTTHMGGHSSKHNNPMHNNSMVSGTKLSQFKSFIDNMPEELRRWIVDIENTGAFEYARGGSGFVVSKANPISGLKPYDVIWTVNGEDIKSFKDYDFALKLSDSITKTKISRLKETGMEDMMIEIEHILGAHISRVVDNSPFYGKLQNGDVVEYYNGVKINDSKDLLRNVLQNRPSESVELKILRDGIRMSIKGVLSIPKMLIPKRFRDK